MNKQKLVSKRNGELAEVVKIENGVYTLLVQGKQIKVKEGTVKRWWKKDESVTEVKPVKKVNQVKEVKSNKSVELKKTEKSKEIKSNEKQFKVTKLPLKSLYHAVRTSNNKWFFLKFNGFTQEQKNIVIDYLLKNGSEKHKKFLIKNNLKKEEK